MKEYFDNLWIAVFHLLSALYDLLDKGLFPVLVAIDLLGNAIAAGNPRTTISARVGYLSFGERSGYWYWVKCIINISFRYFDGKHHCERAYQDAKQRLLPINKGAHWALLLLSFFAVIGSIPVFLLSLIALLFKGAGELLKRIKGVLS